MIYIEEMTIWNHYENTLKTQIWAFLRFQTGYIGPSLDI